MCEAIRTASDRNFRRRCQVAASSCLVLYISSSQLALHYPTGILSLILAGLSGAFFCAELIAVGLLVFRIRDEFQRILLTRSFLWATVITMAFVTIWGFVEMHGHGNVSHLPTLSIPCLLICVTTAAKLLLFRQHKSPRE